MGIIPWLIMMRMRAAEHAKNRAKGTDDDKKDMRLRLQMSESLRKQQDRMEQQFRRVDPYQQAESFLEGGF